MFISASCVNDIIMVMEKEFLYDEVFRKFFPNKDTRDEFKQETYLYILEHPERVVQVYNEKWFRYWFIAMVKQQVQSNSSSWHINFRKPLMNLSNEVRETGEEEDFFAFENELRNEKIKKTKIKLINEALNHYIKIDPMFKPSADFFKEHYVKGMTIRAIGEKYYNTPPTSVYARIREAKEKIKYYIKKHKSHINLN